MSTPEQDARRAATIKGFRDLADFLEQHPGVPAPHYSTLNVFCNDRESIAVVARQSSWEKGYNAHWFYLRKEFGEDVTLEINVSRETVCRRVVTGKTIVAATPEREVDVVEWVCEDASLLAGRS